MADLYGDYLAGAPGLRAFFACPPEAVDAHALEAPPWNETMRAALLDQQRALGLARAIPPEAAVIVTGQQPGLFTGPMYTIAKAATAVKLAARMGRACVPVFWVGADDDDFEEVREAHLLTKRHARRTFRYEPSAPVDGLPLFRMPLSPTLHGLIDGMAAEAPGSEYAGEVTAMLHETLDAARSFSDWFARILAWLFAETPLLVYQPDCPEARCLVAPIIAREIESPLETTRLLNAAGDALEKLGYTRQLAKQAHECNFFLEVDGRRCKVVVEDGVFVLPREGLRFDRAALLALLDAEPARFLPNVALRCVAQQALFPVAAYVAGPGEIAYWAQLGPVFERFGLPMPVVYPRARCVVTTQKLRQLLAKFHLAVADLDAPEEALLDRALAATAHHPALDVLRAHREPIARAYATLLESLESAGPRARSACDRTRNAAAAAAENLERIERTVLREDTAQTEAVRKQVARLREALMPDRMPQERVYCAFSFLFEQGREFLPRLFEAIQLDSFEVNEVQL